jgi:hypothetical protein
VNIEEIANALDAEIARLQQVRDAIAGFAGDTKLRGKPLASRSLEAVINFVPVRSTSAEVEVFSVSMCGWCRVRSAMGIRAM